MRDIEADISAILLSKLDLTPGQTLVAGLAPDSTSDNLVRVSLESSSGEPYNGPTDDLWTATVNIEVRGKQNAYKETLDRTNEVFRALHRAQTNVYVSIVAPELPSFQDEDEKGRPIFGFSVTCTFATRSAGEELVVLEGNGNLDLTSITFPDGSVQTTAAILQDLSEYVTQTGNQTITHKVYEDPIMSGTVYPASQGQSIGSETSPFGALFLSAQSGQPPLVIDQGNVTNQYALEIQNSAGGTSGWRYRPALNRGELACGMTGQTLWIRSVNRQCELVGNGLAYEPVASRRHAWGIRSNMDVTVLAVMGSGTSGHIEDLQQWRLNPTDGPTEYLARVGRNGEIETLAGVILHSPNGTRYRITVTNDGSLAAEEA